MRNRSLNKILGTREESLSDRGGTSYSGHFIVMVNHIAVPSSYVARNLIGEHPIVLRVFERPSLKLWGRGGSPHNRS